MTSTCSCSGPSTCMEGLLGLLGCCALASSSPFLYQHAGQGSRRRASRFLPKQEGSWFGLGLSSVICLVKPTWKCLLIPFSPCPVALCLKHCRPLLIRQNTRSRDLVYYAYTLTHTTNCIRLRRFPKKTKSIEISASSVRIARVSVFTEQDSLTLR